MSDPNAADDRNPDSADVSVEVEEFAPDGSPIPSPHAQVEVESESSEPTEESLGAVDEDSSEIEGVAGELPDGEVDKGEEPGTTVTAEGVSEDPQMIVDPAVGSEEELIDGGEPALASGAAEVDGSGEEDSALVVEPDDDAPVLSWYVLKVQSGRENTIRKALDRNIKIYDLEAYFGEIVVPTEKVAEIRNNKKRIVERKSYPGYIMLQMEYNERTHYLIRETNGIGEFVGSNGKPVPMTQGDIDKMLGRHTTVEEEDKSKAPQIEIPYERGDRVKIKDGPFENFEGSVEDVDKDRGQVKVMLVIFNRNTPVDLEYWQVEKV